MNDKKKKLYDNLIADGYKLGTYAQFEAAMSNASSRSKLYDNLTADGYNLGGLSDFEAVVSGPAPTVAKTPAATSAAPAVNGGGNTPQAPTAPINPFAGPAFTRPDVTNGWQFGPLSEGYGAKQAEAPSAAPKEGFDASKYRRQVMANAKPFAWLENQEREDGIPSSRPVDSSRHPLLAASGRDVASADHAEMAWLDNMEQSRAYQEASLKPNMKLERERVKKHAAEKQTDRWRDYQEALLTIDKMEKELKAAHDATPTHEYGTGGKIAHALLNAVFPNQGKGLDMALEADKNGAYNAAMSELEEKRKRLEAAYTNGGSLSGIIDASMTTVAENAVEGLKDTADFGTGKLTEGFGLLRLVDRMSEGKELTPEERKILETVGYVNETAQAEEDALPQWYRASRVAGASVPFMLQFMVSPVSGVQKAVSGRVTKGLTNRFMSKAAQEAAEKAVASGTRSAAGKVADWTLNATGQVAGDLAASAMLTSTFGFNSSVADALERQTGQIYFDRDPETGAVKTDSYGNAQFVREGAEGVGESLYKAFASNIIENYSEMLGNHLGAPGWLTDNKYARALGKTSVGRGAKSAYKGFTDVTKKAGVHGLGGEIVEEEAGMALNELFGVEDSIPFSAFATPEGDRTPEQQRAVDNFWQQQKDIVTGIGLSMGLMGAVYAPVHAYGYNAAKNNMDRSARTAQYALDGAGRTSFELGEDGSVQWNDEASRWDGLRQRIDATKNDDMGGLFDEIVGSEEYTPEEKKAIVDYMKSLQTWRGYNLGTMQKESTPEQRAEDEAFMAGHEAAPEERTAIRDRYDVAAQKMRAAFNLGDDVDVEEWLERTYPGNTTVGDYLAAMDINDESLDADVRDAILEYFNARGVMNGMEARMGEDVDMALLDNDMWVNGVANQEFNGAVVNATTSDGSDVYVINGPLGMRNENGILTEDFEEWSLDAPYEAFSDASYIVRDAKTGKLRQVPGTELQGIMRLTEDYDIREQRAQRIREAFEQEKARQVGGVPEFNVGDTYYLVDENGYPHTATIAPGLVDNGDGTESEHPLVSIDGTGFILLTDDIKKFITNDMRRKRQLDMLNEQSASETEEPTAEEGAPAETPAAETPAAETPAAETPAAETPAAETPAVETREDVMATEPGDYELDDEVEAMSDSRKKVKGRVTSIDELSGEVEVEWENGNTVGGNNVGRYTPEQLREMLAATKPTRAEVEAASAAETSAVETPAEEPAPAVTEAATETPAAETPAVTEAAVDEAPVVEAAAEEEAREMPTKDDGTPDYVTAGVDRTVAEIENDADLDDEERQAFIKSNISGITSDIAKHDRKKPPMGRNVAEYKRKKAEWQQKRDAMEAELDFWNAVDRKRADNRREQDVYDTENRSAREISAQLGEPRDLEEAVVMAMPGYKFQWGDSPTSRTRGVGSHIGANTEAERKKRVGWLGTKSSEALYPEQVAEQIHNNLPNKESVDYQDVLDIVLDTLRSHHSPRSAVAALAENRANAAARNRDAEEEHYAAMHEEEARNAGFDNVDEYDAWRSGVDAEGLDAVLAGRAAEEAEDFDEMVNAGVDAEAEDAVRSAIADAEAESGDVSEHKEGDAVPYTSSDAQGYKKTKFGMWRTSSRGKFREKTAGTDGPTIDPKHITPDDLDLNDANMLDGAKEVRLLELREAPDGELAGTIEIAYEKEEASPFGARRHRTDVRFDSNPLESAPAAATAPAAPEVGNDSKAAKLAKLAKAYDMSGVSVPNEDAASRIKAEDEDAKSKTDEQLYDEAEAIAKRLLNDEEADEADWMGDEERIDLQNKLLANLRNMSDESFTKMFDKYNGTSLDVELDDANDTREAVKQGARRREQKAYNDGVMKVMREKANALADVVEKGKSAEVKKAKEQFADDMVDSGMGLALMEDVADLHSQTKRGDVNHKRNKAVADAANAAADRLVSMLNDELAAAGLDGVSVSRGSMPHNLWLSAKKGSKHADAVNSLDTNERWISQIGTRQNDIPMAYDLPQLTKDNMGEYVQRVKDLIESAGETEPDGGVDVPESGSVTPSQFDENGMLIAPNYAPALVYHGTTADVSSVKDLERGHLREDGEKATFNGDGIFFTPDRSAAMDYVYDSNGEHSLLAGNVTLHNPYVMYGNSNMEADEAKAFSEELERRGYDGIVVYPSKDMQEIGAYPSEIIVFSQDGVSEPAENSVDVYREESSFDFNGETYSEEDIENMVADYVNAAIVENDLDAQIVGVKVIGSRTRGEEREDSDLDVLVEYEGSAHEDTMFNVINDWLAENDLDTINGVPLDINPITRGKSGTIEQFMKRNEGFTKTAQTDSQGNPVDGEGRLITEKLDSIDELSDKDFTNPQRSVELPELPQVVRDAIGLDGRSVIIKKNIFERNALRHKDLSPGNSREILTSALYSPDLYGQNQKAKRPYNWVVINTKDAEGKNRLVLLELSPEKENAEIVHWHYIDNNGLEKIRRQAEREDGRLLILPSVTEEAGALSGPTLDLPSERKGTEESGNKQEISEKSAENSILGLAIPAELAEVFTEETAKSMVADAKDKHTSGIITDASLYSDAARLSDEHLRVDTELNELRAKDNLSGEDVMKYFDLLGRKEALAEAMVQLAKQNAKRERAEKAKKAQKAAQDGQLDLFATADAIAEAIKPEEPAKPTAKWDLRHNSDTGEITMQRYTENPNGTRTYNARGKQTFKNAEEALAVLRNPANKMQSVLDEYEKMLTNIAEYDALQAERAAEAAKPLTPESGESPLDFADRVDAANREKKSSAEPKPARIVSDERMEELKKKLRNKLRGQLNVGVDPEVLAIGAELAVGHIERGLTKFADYAKAMVDDIGDVIRPYLKSFYNAVRDMPEASDYADAMDSYDDVRKADVNTIETTEKAPEAEKTEKKSQKSEEKVVSSQPKEEPSLFDESSNDEAQTDDNRVHLEAMYPVELDAMKERELKVFVAHQLNLGDPVTSEHDGWTLKANRHKSRKKVRDQIETLGYDLGTQYVAKGENREFTYYDKQNDVLYWIRYSAAMRKNANDEVTVQITSHASIAFNEGGTTNTSPKPQFKVGDKVMYKGEEATIHSIETLGGETEYTLDTGMAPVMYEVAHDGEITLTPNNNEQVQEVRQRAPEEGRNRQSANQNGALGESQQPQAEGSQRGRVDAGNAVHSASDGQRAARPHGVRAQQRQLLEGQNQRNNRAERGTDYAPKSPAARYRANIAAIKLSQKLQETEAVATPEQMEVLRKYSGWGGLGTYLNNDESAKELRDLIGNDAFDQAAMSANSAYFTPAYVVDTLWDVAEKLGFKGGNILEGSAGIGNILGLMPQGISDHSAIHAVEIDGISGTILSQLYPDAQVDIKGFEETKIANGSVDLAITNVPFVTGLMVRDNTGDKDLSKRFRNIHDFCIAKNVRKLREGGLGIFITTSGTLDKSTDLRGWITKEGNADVVGAFRLNNETFGGTNATSDIIIVRKRVNGVKSPNAIDVSSVSAVRSTEYATGEYTVKAGKRVEEVQNLTMTYNGYFAQHPENMGGTMDFNFEHGDTFRPTGTGLYAQRGAKQSDALAAWVNSFDGFSAEAESTKATSPADEVAKLNERLGSGVKEGSLVVNSKGEICVAHLGEAVPIKQSDKKVKGHTRQECLESYNAVKSALADVLDYQSTNADDEGLKPLLKKLNQEYDKFVATYGPFTKNVSIAFLKNDVDYASMTALEHYEEKGDKKGNRKVTIAKRDVFNKRVVKVPVEPQPKNIADAITASIFTQGGIDIPYIAEKLSVTEEEAKKQALAAGHVFENPATGGLEVDYEYLSGNVREKLNIARENEAAYPGRYAANVSALEAVVPMTIPAHLIEYNIGSSWVDKRLFEEYVKARTGVTVHAVSANGTWELRQTSHGTPHNNRDFGVYSDMFKKHILGTTLIEAAMANRSISVSETHRDRYTGTTETITDKVATQACMNKIGEIRQDFKEWAKEYLQQNEEFAQKIEEEYNNRFNNYVPKSIPKSYQREHLDGAWDGITLYPHQSSAVTRALTEPVLLAHEVGTGKTFTQISIAMEMRRLGTARKPMIVVQNATVGQFVASAKLLYPGAKVLTIEDNDKTAEGRKNFYAKIKYNDWDMIVVPQSVFERIPDSPERQAQFIQSKIDEKLATLEALKSEQENNNGSSMIVRSAERELEDLRAQLSEIAVVASDKKKKKDAKREEKTKQNAAVRAAEMLDREVDDVEDFDDMGIDAILVDEAHEYKHLGFATAMQRGVKGVDPSYSKKAQSVYLKTQAVLEKSGGKNVVFATGTPISNTAAEIWTFMKYLMPERTMKDYGIYYFDDFVRNFGSIQQMLEFKTSGKFGEVNRFSAYVNLPELNRIWSSVADTVLTADAGKVSDKIPAIDGGKAEDIYLPQSRSLRAIMASVRAELERFEQMSGKDKKANSHIPLVCFGIAAKAAIDPRLASDNAPDEPQSKTNRAVEEVYADLQKTKSYKGTCAIFCDSYRNKNTGFNVYNEIADKLIAKGVPADQIFIMTSGMSVKKKAEVFDKVNRGEIRVILGSTQTLGTGVNIQERLHLLIHMDVPNRPMDYTQRNGRILRQGNLHKEWNLPVRILRFGVEDSLDVTGYQRLKTKGAIADSIMNGRKTLANNQENRTIEEEEDQFGDTIAQLSGSEYAMLKNKAERDVRKYESKKKAHEADQVYVANTIRRNTAAIAQTEKALAEEKRLLGLIEEEYSGKEPTIKVGSDTFASMNDMEEFFKEFNKKQREREDNMRTSYSPHSYTPDQTSTVDVKIGKFNFRFSTKLELTHDISSTQMRVHRSMKYSCPELGLSDVPVNNGYLKNGVQDILENVVTGADLRSGIRIDETSIKRMSEELEALRAREGKPFPFDAELEEAQNLLDEYTEKMREELEAKEAKYAEMDKEAGVADVGIGETSTDDLEDDDVLYRDDDEEDMSVRAQMERAMAGLKAHGPVFVVSSLDDIETNFGWMKARRKSEYDELVDYFNDPNGPAALYLHEVGDVIVFNRADGEIVGLHSSIVHEQVHSAMEKGVISLQELVDFYTSENPLVMAVDKDIQSRGYKGAAVPEETLAHVVEFLTFDFATNSRKGIEVCEALENDPKVSTVIQKIQDFIYEDETRADKFWQRAVNARRRGAGSESLSSREDGNAPEGSRIESQNREGVQGREGAPLFRLADEEEARELEKEPTMRVYRAMQLVENEDGTKMLVPPMAGKIEGKWQTGIKLDANGNILPGQWEVSEERPDLLDKNGKFKLNKGNGKSPLAVAYNPYYHTSPTPLNDQFSEAQSRPNLVTVEVEVPVSELTSGYRAEGAKDSVGRIEWKAGIIQGQLTGTRSVILSRYDKPARIVPDSEVAKVILDMFDGKKITMPSNVVTPSLRAELEKLGVPFVETDNKGRLTEGENKGVHYSKVYGKSAAKLREAEQAFLDARDSGKWKRGKGHPTLDHLARHLKMWTDAFGERVKFEVHRDGSAFTGRKAKAKGWFDPKTGKVHIILDNHHSDTDLQRTIFHEVAAHLGLRKMLGKDFYTFLNNIYENAEQRIKDEIDKLAREKYKGNRHTATEEYMAKIAERMAGDVFPGQTSTRLWYKMLEYAKKKLVELLRKIGVDLGFELTDEDIAYVLWESYSTVLRDKSGNNIFETAADIDMQQRLGVRNFADFEETEARLRKLRRRTRLMDHSVAEDETEYDGDITKSESFKNWFGDWENNPENASKVVDKNGEPLVVHHGTNSYGFTVFNTSAEWNEDNVGSHFGDYSTASDFGNEDQIYNVYLNIRNPWTADYDFFADNYNNAYLEECFSLAKEIGTERAYAVLDRVREVYPEMGDEVFNRLKSQPYAVNDYYDEDEDLELPYWDRMPKSQRVERKRLFLGHRNAMVQILRDLLEAGGYDGIRYNNWYEGEGNNDSWVVLNSNQIKSADTEGEMANNGEFDTDNNDIRFRDSDDTAYDEYESQMPNKQTKWNERVGYRFQEAWQDSMLSLKKLQEAIVKESGKPLQDFENAYTAENRMSSMNAAAAEVYEREYFRPMIDEVAKLVNSGVPYEEVVKYVMAKHGLERNRVMTQREIDKELDKLREDLKKDYTPEMLDMDDVQEEINNEVSAKRQELREWYAQNPKDFAGLSSLFDEESFDYDAQEYVDAFENEHDTTDLWDKINAATKNQIDRAYAAGLIDKQTRDMIKGMYEYYIPLRGFDETTAEDMYQYMTSETSPYNTPIKTAKGRKSVADDPFATIGNMAESGIMQANRNRMKQHLYRAALNHKTSLLTVGQQWYAIDNVSGQWIPAFPEVNDDMTPAEYKQAIDEFNAKMADLESQDLATQNPPKADVRYRAFDKQKMEHTVVVKVNGKDYNIYVNGNPRAAQAVNGQLNPDTTTKEGVFKWGKKINNWMARNFTSRNPGFVLTNLSRDVIFSGTAVLAKENTRYFAQYSKNIGSAFAHATLPRLIHKWNNGTLDDNNEVERYFKEFMMMGGETGYTRLNTVEDYKKKIGKQLRELQKGKNIPRKAWDGLWESIEFLNRSAEDTTRFMVYMTSRQMGRSRERATWDAKEITVNFNKKGSGALGAKWVNLLYVFSNAAIQGLTNFGRLIKQHKGKMAAVLGTFTAAGMLAPALSVMMQALFPGGDDDDELSYWDIPEWTRRNNLVFYIPFTGNKFITIPLPHELRPFFGLGEMSFSAYQGKKKWREVPGEAAASFAALLPLDFTGNGGNLAVAMTPTYAQPIAQIAANKDYFGKPIDKETPYNENKPEWSKAYRSTNGLLVDATRWLNEITGGNDVKSGWLDLNPAWIEHAFESYLGGTGKTINEVGKTISMAWNEDAREVRNIPVVNKFLQSAEERTSNSGISNQYYKYLDEAKETKRLLDEYGKRLDDPEYAAYRTELVNSPDFVRYAIMEEYKKPMELLREAAKNAESRSQVKAYEKRIAEMQREIVGRLEEARNGVGKSEKNRVAFKMAQYKDIEKRMQKEETAYNKAVKDGSWTPQMQEAEIKRQQSPEYTIYGLYKSYESLMQKYKEAYGENSEEYQKAEAEYKPYYFKLMQDAEKKR